MKKGRKEGREGQREPKTKINTIKNSHWVYRYSIKETVTEQGGKLK